MTKQEFENLKFGDIFYNSKGDRYIVVAARSDQKIIMEEHNYNSGIRTILSGAGFSLEKPKKKVKKEIIRYATNTCINDLGLDMDIQGRVFTINCDEIFNNKITITYEAEE